MLRVTPGVALLGRTARAAVIPTAAIGAARYYAREYVPTWLLVSAAILMAPIYLCVHILVTDLKQRREAASMGARLAPTMRGKLPGNIDILRKMVKNIETGYPGDDQVDALKELGTTFNMYILWKDVIFTIDPQNIKAILATDFTNYVKGDAFDHNMGSVLGTGVFNSDGDMWKFHRTMTRPFFTRDRISDFDNFDRHGMMAIEKIKHRLREGYAVDFQDVISRFTLDSATEFLFGNDVRSLYAPLPYPENTFQARQNSISNPADVFAHAFMEVQHIISSRGRFGVIWPLFETFKDKTIKPMKVVKSYLEPILKEAVEKHKTSLEEEKAEEGQENMTLLDHLVRETSDPVILRDEILNILIAGRDTTAATLTFVMYCLSRHPNFLHRLREEILTHVGPIRRPNYDDIRDMKFLRAVINETLRLYPAVPFDVRESVKATTWPSPDPAQKPIYIPAKTAVPYSVFLMHRRTDLWGPDALEFDPDRFLDHRLKQYLAPNPFIFLPFNAGPRICLGQQFAYNEMSFMLIRIFQNFSSISLALNAQPAGSHPPAEWANSSGPKSTEQFFPKSHLTMYAHGGLWVNMTETADTA